MLDINKIQKPLTNTTKNYQPSLKSIAELMHACSAQVYVFNFFLFLLLLLRGLTKLICCSCSSSLFLMCCACHPQVSLSLCLSPSQSSDSFGHDFWLPLPHSNLNITPAAATTPNKLSMHAKEQLQFTTAPPSKMQQQRNKKNHTRARKHQI
jgi:recombinational DNA repair protein (RecF pathway)